MLEELFSPQKTFKVAIGSYEVKMSHWVDQPYLIRVSDDVELFNLNGDPWSASDVTWLDDSTVEMHLRRYPGHIFCSVQLNALTDQGWAKVRRVSSQVRLPRYGTGS
ncbi:hypothetical protein [Spirosoma aureum]|uniref:hypothetical protein n=1 Tax=Spirosoma aureum TaxID=2692134 RepID=UPI001E5B89F1|nr:hypothetical protein [Spirosoma aureum]